MLYFLLVRPRLEEVFKQAGRPTFTFVTPLEYDRLRIALRTPGRGVVLEGASGIGKTTAISKLIDDFQANGKTFQYLTTRRPNDLSTIRNLSIERSFGRIIIDDFHRLDEKLKSHISDIMKVLADTEDAERKIVIIGINEAGKSIVNFSKDLNERIEYIKIRRVPDKSVHEMIRNGEEALNITIRDKNSIVKDSHGCFHIAQMLCFEYCVSCGIEEFQDERKEVSANYYIVKEKILGDLGRRFGLLARAFSSGPDNKKEGRAPYLNLLKILSESEDWMVNVRDLAMTSKLHRVAFGNMVTKRSPLRRLFDKNPDLKDVIYFNSISKDIAIEDPKFMFYVRNLPWNSFARNLGFSSINFRSQYDVALSFAGQDRPIAERLFDELSRRELEVFYDFNEQDRIAGQDVEDYLMPIYRSEADIIVPIISSSYPTRIWTRLETEAYRHRFSRGSVVPIRVDNYNDVFLLESEGIGGLSLNTSNDIGMQIKEIAEVLCRKITHLRQEKVPNTELSADD